MKRLWRFAGVAAFWVSWPLLYFYLRDSQRTRVLIVCGDQVVAIHSWHSSGKWSLPGGGLHEGEAPARGAAREVREEIGLQLKAVDLKPLGSAVYHERGLHFSCQYFIAVLTRTATVHAIFPEVVEARWCDYREFTPANSDSALMAAISAWKRQGLVQ